MQTSIKTYTLQEAADIMHITKPTIYKFIKQGILKAGKCGRKYIILEDDLMAAIQGPPTGEK